MRYRKICFYIHIDPSDNRVFTKQKNFAMLRCSYKTDLDHSLPVVRTAVVASKRVLLRNQIFEGHWVWVRSLGDDGGRLRRCVLVHLGFRFFSQKLVNPETDFLWYNKLGNFIVGIRICKPSGILLAVK